jgi:diguanylate cyclase (GGDEF)-like protein/PAS domain S-box-containing protein
MLGVKAVKEGAQDYLVKGQVDSYLLMHAIRYAIERQRVQIALRESEERYALAVGGANDGLWDWKLETNVIYLSPRWKFLLGYGENEIGNSPEEWFNRIHPEELEQVKADIAAHLEGHIPHFENEHRMKHKDGTYRWMLSRGLAVRGADGKAYRMAGSQTEITDRKMAEEKLFYDASHDALTGLPNRSLFMDLLSRSIGHAKRHEDYLFAVLFLDLDRFKVINDSLGHQIGDQLLIEISKSVEKTLRPNDTMARLGGDEFAILLDDLENASHATRVAGRIQKRLSIPFNLSGHQGVYYGEHWNRPEYDRL